MYVPVFGRLPAGLPHIPACSCKICSLQSSGVVAYFREISLKGFRLFRNDGLGRQGGWLEHCEKECLGCVKLYLGTVVEAEDSVDKDMRTDQCSWCHRCVCNQISWSRRGRWSLLWTLCPRSSSALERLYSGGNYVEVFSLLLGLLGKPDPRSRCFSNLLWAKWNISIKCEPILSPAATFCK